MKNSIGQLIELFLYWKSFIYFILFACAGSLLLRAGFLYLWWVGEHIWHLVRTVHVTKSAWYLLFFRSEKILQKVLVTIMTIFINNNTMSCLPFLVTLSCKLASHTWLSQASRMAGRESHTDAEGPVSVRIAQTQGHVPKREDLLLLACGLHSTWLSQDHLHVVGVRDHRVKLVHPQKVNRSTWEFLYPFQKLLLFLFLCNSNKSKKYKTAATLF